MTILQKVMHTSRPLEIEDSAAKFAKNFEMVLELEEGAVTVELVEHDQMKPCASNPVPHCHYGVTITYDESRKLKPVKPKRVRKKKVDKT